MPGLVREHVCSSFQLVLKTLAKSSTEDAHGVLYWLPWLVLRLHSRLQRQNPLWMSGFRSDLGFVSRNPRLLGVFLIQIVRVISGREAPDSSDSPRWMSSPGRVSRSVGNRGMPQVIAHVVNSAPTRQGVTRGLGSPVRARRAKLFAVGRMISLDHVGPSPLPRRRSPSTSPQACAGNASACRPAKACDQRLSSGSSAPAYGACVWKEAGRGPVRVERRQRPLAGCCLYDSEQPVIAASSTERNRAWPRQLCSHAGLRIAKVEEEAQSHAPPCPAPPVRGHSRRRRLAANSSHSHRLKPSVVSSAGRWA